jgi:uncharacterized membrane protein
MTISTGAERLVSRQSRPLRGAARRTWPARLRDHAPYLLLLVAGTVFFLALALRHHYALGTGYDLGIYDQVVWNIAHGRLFMTTLVYETGGYYDHFEPVLTMIAPLYWLFPDARVLIILQSLALALGSLPIYLYARLQLAKYGRWAVTVVAPIIAAAYLLYPALHNANLNDFHEVGLVPPLLGFALFGLLRGRRKVLFIFLALCLMVKEDLSVTALAISLYIFLLKPKGFRRRDGVWMAALTIIWVVLILKVFYPALTRGMPYPFVARRYPWLGDSPQSALSVLLTQPWIMLPHLLQAPKLTFLLRLFGPLLFLPLLGWPVMGLAMPILIYLMLSSYEPQWSVQSYYNPPLVPILFFALVRAWRYALDWLQARPRVQQGVLAGLTVALVLGVGYGYWIDAPGPGSQIFSAANFNPSPRAEAAYQIIAQVPVTASVSTEWSLAPRLSERQNVYTLLARPVNPPDYLLSEPQEGAESAPLYPYIAASTQPLVYHEYSPVSSVGPFRLEKRTRSLTLASAPEPKPGAWPLVLGGYAWLDGPSASQPPAVHPGDTIRLMLAWHRLGSLDKRYVFFVHMLDQENSHPNGSPKIAAQSGHEVGNGRFPTTLWETWTNPPVVFDEQDIQIPANTPDGVYYLWAGAYNRDNFERLEVGGTGQTLVQFATLTVQR